VLDNIRYKRIEHRKNCEIKEITSSDRRPIRLLPNKIDFSYYWLKNNKVRKAAALGFPRARTLLKQQEKLRQKNPPKSYQISSYSRANPYYEVTFVVII